MKYLATALAAAVLAFLVASLLVRERATVPRPPSAAATFEQRFPEQAAAYHQPASVDARWQEKRGHAWSIADREETDPEGDPRWTRILGARPKLRPQPTACLTCHAAAGTARASSYYEARDRKPLGCPDCHERQGDLRSAVCEQCHREYYIVAGQAAFPEGRTADQIEAFYESRGTGDWIHAGTVAVVLKARARLRAGREEKAKRVETEQTRTAVTQRQLDVRATAVQQQQDVEAELARLRKEIG